MIRVGTGVFVFFLLACSLSPEPDPLGFDETAFLDLDWEASAEFQGPIVLSEDGDLLYVATADGVVTLDVSSGLEFLNHSGADHTVHDVWRVGDRLVVGHQSGGATIGASDDGVDWQWVATTTLPFYRLTEAGDLLLLAGYREVLAVDRATFLGRDTTDADVLFRVPFPLDVAGEVALRGDVLWAGSQQGVYALDIAEPSDPRLLYKLGDWIADTVRLQGDLLLVQTGYQSTAFDVSDPYAPVMLGFVHGGRDIAFHDDHLYAIDRMVLYVSELTSGLPVPVRKLDLGGDCEHLEVNDDAVFLMCFQTLHRLAPNRP